MTIFALSSGPGISGVAIIRVSGIQTKNVISALTKKELPDFEEVIAINKIVYDLNKKLGDSYSIRYVEKLLMEFSRQKLFEIEENN